MSVNACRRSPSFLDFPCPRCAPGRWSSVGYEAGRRSGHGAKVPGAPSVRRRGGPAFMPHQAPLTPHIATHGSVSCRCSSSSSTSYGAGCRPGHRRSVAGRPVRDVRGTDVTGPANAGVERRAVSPLVASVASRCRSLRRSVARLGGRPRGGELHPLLGRGEPLQGGGAQLVDEVRGVGGVVLVRQPVAGPGAGVPWLARGSAGASLIAQRSQVQILPPLQRKSRSGAVWRETGKPPLII